MSLRYLLDTSICVDVLRRRSSRISDRLNVNTASMAVSTIVVMELLHGVERSSDPPRTRSEVMDFFDLLIVLPFDVDAAAHASHIRAELGRTGKNIGPYDCLIAGHARSRGLTIVTANEREFARVAGVLCENWR